MNFTYNNHLQYYMNDRLWGYRLTQNDKYIVKLGQIDKERYITGNFESELQRTAGLVSKEFGSDFVLLLSGGTDSEIVAHNFLSVGIKPKCVTIKFKDDYNITDVEEAVRIATSLGLEHDIIDFDIKNFLWSGEAEEFGSEIQCTQITYLMCYKLIKDLQCAAVMGGEALLSRSVGMNSKSYWYWTFRENEDASAIRFSIKYNLPLVNEWFSYTPELLLHYLEDPEIFTLVTEKYNYKLTSVSSKNKILKRLCPYVTPKKKTHGFEQLLGFNYQAYKDIGFNQIKRIESSLDGIPYDVVIKTLKGEA